jgi:hypothetical protein
MPSITAKPLATVHKATTSTTLAFPDVCHTPGVPGGMVPIPYPSMATTAVSSQRRKVFGVSVGAVAAKTASSTGVAQREMQQLQARLNLSNARLQALRTSDANEWQKVLEEYLVLASALYRTKFAND